MFIFGFLKMIIIGFIALVVILGVSYVMDGLCQKMK